MANPIVSLRISDYHLARALRAIITIEPHWQFTTPSALVRTIFNDYIAKSERQHNHSLDVAPEILYKIAHARQRHNQRNQPQLGNLSMTQISSKTLPNQNVDNSLNQLSLIDNRTPPQRQMDEQGEKIIKQQQQTDQPDQTDLDKQIKLAQIIQSANKPPMSKSTEETTESDITTITDFSPPADWKSDNDSSE